jgi:hypothetical protein
MNTYYNQDKANPALRNPLPAAEFAMLATNLNLNPVLAFRPRG